MTPDSLYSDQAESAENASSGSLVDEAFWSIANATREWSVASPADPVRRWIEENVPLGNGADCLEVGCVPGRYLAVLGMLGYRLNGIDLTPRVEPELRTWLSRQGYPVGHFVRTDFGEFAPLVPYQLVCSFGFIEHFEDWRTVLLRHAEMVRPGGYLVITTPNFRGAVQQHLHRWFDAESLARHNIDAMQPQSWAEAVRPLGFHTIRAGHFGRFTFWVEAQRRGILSQLGTVATTRLAPLLSLAVPEGSASFAPYCGFIARRDG